MVEFKRSVPKKVITIAILIIVAIWSLFPMYLILTTSFKNRMDVLASPPKMIVFTPTVDNYVEIFNKTELPKYYLNSIIVSIATVSLSLFVGIPASYAMVRYSFKGKRFVSFLLFLSRIFPPVALLTPIFILWAKLGLVDTRFGLILIYIQMNMSLVVWMLIGFFGALPVSLEESAMIDGCTRFQAFIKVIIPLAAPGIAATAVLLLIFSWNEFLFAFALTGRIARTAPVTVYNFMEFEEIQWGLLQSAGVLVTLPVLIFTLLVEKYLVRGLTAGAVK